MRKEVREQWTKAFGRLSFKDRVILLIALITGMTFLGIALVGFMAGGPLLIRSVFPESALAMVEGSSGREIPSYPELTERIRFPGSSYTIRIGGTESFVGETGTSFRYSDNTVLLAFFEDPSKDTAHIIEESFPAYLSGNDTSGARYRKRVDSDGYHLGLFLKYEGGTLRSGGTSYYVLSYRYSTAEGKDILIASATVNPSELVDDRRLLLHMAETLAVAEEPAVPADDQTFEPKVRGRGGRE